MLKRMVEAKLDQWRSEAILAAIQHGRKGGEFKTELWANSKTMVTPVTPWATVAHAIPLDTWEALRNTGWAYAFLTR